MNEEKQPTLAEDKESSLEWIRLMLPHMERLAIQYGLRPQQAANFVETVFQKLYENRSEALHEDDTIRILLGRLEDVTIHPSDEKLFAFKEDEVLHNRMIDLPKEVRIPFILNLFHNKSTAQIAEILNVPTEQVETQLAEAFQQLNEPNLEKKLEFLHTSYGRLQTLYDEDRIFTHTTHHSIEPAKLKGKKPKRKTLAMWSLGVAMLFTLLFVSVTNSEAYQKSASEKFIEAYKEEFEKEIAKRLELAGLTKRTAITMNHYNMYGEDTRLSFKDWLRALTRELEENGKIDRRKAKEDYAALINELKLPSELMAELKNKPLVNDRTASIAFIGNLIGSSSMLIQSYSAILQDHEDVIPTYEWNDNGTVIVQTLAENDEGYPKQLQDALKGMKTQNITVVGHDSMFHYPQFGDEQLIEDIQNKLHPSVHEYVNLLIGGFEEIVKKPLDEQVDLLFFVEDDLMGGELTGLFSNEYVEQMIVGSYMWLFHSILGLEFESMERSYNLSGDIKPEYRKVWKQIADREQPSPAATVMTTVIENMEKEGWSRNTLENQNSYMEIYDLIWPIIQEKKENNK